MTAEAFVAREIDVLGSSSRVESPSRDFAASPATIRRPAVRRLVA
jgi:hypothetical protein